MVTTLGAITATARATFVLPTSFGSIVAAVTNGEPLELFELLETRPPAMPPKNAIAATSSTPRARIRPGRPAGACGGMLTQWESELMC